VRGFCGNFAWLGIHGNTPSMSIFVGSGEWAEFVRRVRARIVEIGIDNAIEHLRPGSGGLGKLRRCWPVSCASSRGIYRAVSTDGSCNTGANLTMSATAPAFRCSMRYQFLFYYACSHARDTNSAHFSAPNGKSSMEVCFHEFPGPGKSFAKGPPHSCSAEPRPVRIIKEG